MCSRTVYKIGELIALVLPSGTEAASTSVRLPSLMVPNRGGLERRDKETVYHGCLQEAVARISATCRRR